MFRTPLHKDKSLALYPNEWIKSLAELEKKLSYRFSKPQLLVEALTHSSWAKDHNRQRRNRMAKALVPWNERMEFLGDSVLGLVVSSYLIRMHDRSIDEGNLSKFRASIVNTEHLIKIATGLDLEKYILLASGESRLQTSMLADAMEALLGAVFLDRGYEKAKKLIEDLFGEALREDAANADLQDFKSLLQETMQNRFRETPHYRLVRRSGPAHEPSFVMAVYLKDKVLGEGEGATKKIASQKAAEKALIKLGSDKSGNPSARSSS